MAFLVKISSWGCGALMKRCAFSRAPSYASVASAASLYALRLIGAYAVSMNRVMASMTTRGLLAAVGRVEVHDGPAVDLHVQQREVLADPGDIEVGS